MSKMKDLTLVNATRDEAQKVLHEKGIEVEPIQYQFIMRHDDDP